MIRRRPASSKFSRPFAFAAALALCCANAAHAGRAPINAEHFEPQLDGRGLFNAESPDALQQWQWGVGTMLHYARNPLVISDGTRKRLGLVEDRVMMNVMASLALTDWLTVGASLPVALINEQNAGLASTGVGVTGLGSMRLQLKFRILDEARHHIGVAFIPSATLPTGNHNAFLGQNGVAFSPMLAIERHFGPVRALLNVGYTLREETRYFNIVVDDELFWRVALGVRVHEKVEVGAELNGATAAAELFGSNVRRNPLEVLAGARVLLTDRLQLYGGAGPGLSTGYGTPTFRFFAGVLFAPHERDTDGDGLIDSKDRCPLVPGPRENQGCPWPDTDGDGLTDNVDACPTTPGPKENKGCPWPDSDGDGILDKDDRCPYLRGPIENQGCPWPDRDKDGVLDKDDGCPDVPGPAENKGCPWPDRDGDGVLDKDDRCPDVPGPQGEPGLPRRAAQAERPRWRRHPRCGRRVSRRARPEGEPGLPLARHGQGWRPRQRRRLPARAWPGVQPRLPALGCGRHQDRDPHPAAGVLQVRQREDPTEVVRPARPGREGASGAPRDQEARGPGPHR